MALIVLGVLLTVLLLLRPSMGSGTPNHDYSYSRFVRAVTNDKVRSATIDSNGKVTGSLKNGDDYTSQIPTALRDLPLAPLLSKHKVNVTGKGPPGTSLLSILLASCPCCSSSACSSGWGATLASRSPAGSWASAVRGRSSTTRTGP